jgi:arsenite-transporting ATPase
MQEVRFKAALDALSDPAENYRGAGDAPGCTGAIAEASRTSEELHALGLHNQRMVVNGVFHASNPLDTIAHSIEKLGMQAIAETPVNLLKLPQDYVALRAFDTVGLAALRALLGSTQPSGEVPKPMCSTSAMPRSWTGCPFGRVGPC